MRPAKDRFVSTGYTDEDGCAIFRCGVCGNLTRNTHDPCPDDNWKCEDWDGSIPVVRRPMPNEQLPMGLALKIF
jgi:hypothetical protein